MGCDIHLYIEYKEKDQTRWGNFGGYINPGRNYWMFGAMAGVRATHINGFEPKGIPNDLGSSSSSDYWKFIIEDESDDSEYASINQAQRWRESGCSRIYEPDKPLLHNRVSDPDAHSESWLTSEEYETAIGLYLKAEGYQFEGKLLNSPDGIIKHAENDIIKSISEYWAILAAMKCFEAQGFETRIVFWFDN